MRRMSVERCVRYLREIGADVSEAQVAQWRDAENVSRFLKSTRHVASSGYEYRCPQGHSWFREVARRARRKTKDAAGTCPECGDMACIVATRFQRLRDGSIRDFRPMSERWRPIDFGGAA